MKWFIGNAHLSKTLYCGTQKMLKFLNISKNSLQVCFSPAAAYRRLGKSKTCYKVFQVYQ